MWFSILLIFYWGKKAELVISETRKPQIIAFVKAKCRAPQGSARQPLYQALMKMRLGEAPCTRLQASMVMVRAVTQHHPWWERWWRVPKRCCTGRGSGWLSNDQTEILEAQEWKAAWHWLVHGGHWKETGGAPASCQAFIKTLVY